MAGMEALGRLLNIIPTAAAKPFRMRGASGVLVVVTGADAVVTVKEDSTFGGSFSTTLLAIKDIYWTTASDGTAAWNKLSEYASPLGTYTHGSTTGLTTATVTAFHLFTSELTDPNDYLKITVTGTTPTCAVIPYDLVAQRAPANLEVLGA
jgi:hypothetical protein